MTNTANIVPTYSACGLRGEFADLDIRIATTAALVVSVLLARLVVVIQPGSPTLAQLVGLLGVSLTAVVAGQRSVGAPATELAEKLSNLVRRAGKVQVALAILTVVAHLVK